MYPHLQFLSLALKSEQQINNIKPNKKELVFLELSYNRFYDLYEKLEKGKDKLSPKEKFSLLKNVFQIYNECLRYEPIQYFLKLLETERPSGENISFKYFKVIRHIFIHFPFFDKWNDVYFTRDLITWSETNSRIDKFLLNNEGKNEYKWRIWDEDKKKMKYGYIIKFPKDYGKNTKIFIKNLIDEDKGIEISLLMIKRVLESQIESIK